MKNIKIDSDKGKAFYEFDKPVNLDKIQYTKGLSKLVTGDSAPVQTEVERILNEKILKITMTIKNQYPELSKYLEEMPVTIPDEEHPDVTINQLKQYYDSLDEVLRGYKKEHSINGDIKGNLNAKQEIIMYKFVVRVNAVDKINHDVLKIITEKPLEFNFNPGQATQVSINKKMWEDKHKPFTMTCIPADDYLEFTIKTYPERKGVTNQLLSIKQGDELILQDVFGRIGYRGEGTFIAGGAGITPFISIFRQLQVDGKIGDNKLLFANKMGVDIILEQELKEIFGDNCIHILSEEELPGLAHGKISPEFIKEHCLSFEKYFYVCGPPPMMEAVHKQLSELHVLDDIIVQESL